MPNKNTEITVVIAKNSTQANMYQLDFGASVSEAFRVAHLDPDKCQSILIRVGEIRKEIPMEFVLMNGDRILIVQRYKGCLPGDYASNSGSSIGEFEIIVERNREGSI